MSNKYSKANYGCRGTFYKKKRKQYPGTFKTYYDPENKTYIYCLGQAKVGPVSRKYVVRFDGVIHVHHRAHRCIDDVCHEAHGHTFFRSAPAVALSVKGYTYGMDILVYISERNVEYLFGVYEGYSPRIKQDMQNVWVTAKSLMHQSVPDNRACHKDINLDDIDEWI